MDKLNILDRWIIAKTHVLIENSVTSMDQFRVDLFMRSFETFLEELSNWYIRRNRRRFWKSEDDQDKNSAYATLYHVLTKVIRIIAPVLPFVSETIYQNLVVNSESGSAESVHLCDYPKPDAKWIDLNLIKNVDSLKKFVELGRSARSKCKIKIRQPLSKVSFAIEDDGVAEFYAENKEIILDELNVKSVERITDSDQLISYKIKPNLRTLGQKYGKGLSEIRHLLEEGDPGQMVSRLQSDNELTLANNKYVLHREDVFIETEATDGFAAESGNGITVGLSLDLTEELIMEGLVRDIVRFVQSMRKNAGFAVEDRIEISWDFDGQILDAVGKFKDYFCAETLTGNIKDKIIQFYILTVVTLNDLIFDITCQGFCTKVILKFTYCI
jgi:isoleucyl-tRNA synthetase